MNKKGSMELSVNSIVILVIAIVMLGLILGFVKSKFGDLNKQIVTTEPEAPTATSSEPITVSRAELIVNAGEQVALKFQVYALGAITIADVPSITCGANVFTLSVNGKTANAGEVVKYQSLVQVPNSLGKGKAICSLGFTTATPGVTYPSKDLIVDVQ
jgi:hypothetical protein